MDCQNKVVTAWNRKTHKIALTVREHTDLVNTVDLSPDSTRFVTGPRDERAIIWEISTGKQLIDFTQFYESVSAVKSSPEGDRIAVAVWGFPLRVYNAHGQEACEARRHDTDSQFLRGDHPPCHGQIWSYCHAIYTSWDSIANVMCWCDRTP